MGYQNLINTNLDKAFNLAQDLATTAVFSRTNSNSFDFSSGVATSSVQNITSKVILISKEKRSEKGNTIQLQIMAKTKELGDLKNFDLVTISNIAWRIGSVILDSGNILTLQLYREA